eukprot:6492727-Amphidinium_carterae.4
MMVSAVVILKLIVFSSCGDVLHVSFCVASSTMQVMGCVAMEAQFTLGASGPPLKQNGRAQSVNSARVAVEKKHKDQWNDGYRLLKRHVIARAAVLDFTQDNGWTDDAEPQAHLPSNATTAVIE